MPETEEILTIEGALERASSGSACLHPKNTPSAFTAMTLRQSLGGFGDVAGGGDAGVVHQAIEAPPGAGNRLHGRAPILLAGDVEGDVNGTTRAEIAADGRAARRLDGLAHGTPMARPSVPSAPVMS